MNVFVKDFFDLEPDIWGTAIGMFFICGIRDGARGGEAQLFSRAQINFCVHPLFGGVQINLIGSDAGG